MIPKLTEPQGQVIDTQHRHYYESALVNFNLWLQSDQLLDQLGSVLNVHYRGPLQWASKYGLVVFSALTLEALINFYAESEQLPNRTDYEKSLSIRNKWQIYPQLISKNSINTKAIRYIGSIFRLRNRLVHFKPRWRDPYPDPTTFKIFGYDNGITMLNKLHYCVRSLNEIWPKCGTDWINTDIEGGVDWSNRVRI